MILEPIGVVESPVKSFTDEGWGRVTARIVLRPEYRGGLTGLEGFSHLLVVFHMHLAEFDAARHLTRHPQDNSAYPVQGVFALRASDRPNPIGVTVAEIEGVGESTVTVRDLDAVDGTPVLDLKPYFPQFDSRPDARVPAWVAERMRKYF